MNPARRLGIVETVGALLVLKTIFAMLHVVVLQLLLHAFFFSTISICTTFYKQETQSFLGANSFLNSDLMGGLKTPSINRVEKISCILKCFLFFKKKLIQCQIEKCNVTATHLPRQCSRVHTKEGAKVTSNWPTNNPAN